MSSPKDKYKLDRTAFKAFTFEEADNHYAYWENISLKERLEAAYYLIQSAYGYIGSDLPPVDRTLFSTRKFED